MSDVMTLPAPGPVTECRRQIHELFDPGFIELLRLAPRNPHVRALLLKLTGLMPAEELETFEQLQNWAETSCKALPIRDQPRPAFDGISINVEFADTEYGRANYSVSRSASALFELEADELMEIVQTAIEDGNQIGEIVKQITAKIEEDAWERSDPDMDDSGDYDYTDHESTDSGGGSLTYSDNEIRQAVLAYLRARHPDLAAQL